MEERKFFYYQFSCLCLLFLLGIHGSLSLQRDPVSNSLWYLPRPIVGYRSYMDVYPVRVDLPRGLENVIWGFLVSVSSGDCSSKNVTLMIQHSGLPLISQDKESLPDNFLDIHYPILKFNNVTPRGGQYYEFLLRRPPMGSWYIAVFMNGVNQNIRQKGLFSSDNCVMAYTTHVQMLSSFVKQDVSVHQTNNLVLGPSGSLISFTVAPNTYAFDVIVTGCGSTNCSFNMEYHPFTTIDYVSHGCDIGATEPCKLHVPSPPYQDEQLIFFRPSGPVPQEITYLIIPHECKPIEEKQKSGQLSEEVHCLSFPVLDRLSMAEPLFAGFGHIIKEESVMSLNMPLSSAVINVIPFEIKEPNDIGSTLKWRVKKGNISQSILKETNIRVCGGIVYNSLPDMSIPYDVCANASGSTSVMVTASSSNESIVFVPYPAAGLWYLMLQVTCYSNQNGTETRCPKKVEVAMALLLKPCEDDGCNGRGNCLYKTAGSDLISMASCKCAAGYQGYVCTDGSHALSDAVQLAGALLLTLSNLFFIPSIIVAVRRKFYLEAFVYTYTMFFSTFYHACDGDRVDEYKKCIIRFDVLQSGDFFGSSCSLWFTLIAMTQIRIFWLPPLLQILGPFCLIIGIIYDKTSLYVIAIPTACGLVALVVSWGHKMYRRKRLYPSLKRYLFFLLPGIILAVTGAVVFAFLETEENYKYLHSIWHVSIAVSICFLLPPKNAKWEDTENTGAIIASSYLLNSIDGVPDSSRQSVT